jgi:hypothetical protein
MTDEYDSWRRYEDAKAFKNKLAEIDRLKGRIEKLETALREIGGGPTCCPVSNAMRDVAREALEGKDE